MRYDKIIIFSTLLFLTYSAHSQSISSGSPLEEYYRRKQLRAELDPSVSFSIRPVFPSASFNVSDVFDPDNTLKSDTYLNPEKSGKFKFANDYGEFQILPFSVQNQFNSHHPYGWNDGAMIPARGYQTMVSGGFFAKIGPLSIQLRPEFVYAQNNAFDGFNKDRNVEELNAYYWFHNVLDEPERFGIGDLSKFNWGQSSIRLTVGPISAGLSNENIWWGPGKRSAILFTNNAKGFNHLTLNTIKPIKTFVGSFEMQIIAGRLENSGIDPLPMDRGPNEVFNTDWRYLTGFNINYQPKWIPGLFLGFSRNFMSYHEDLNSLGDYLPFFAPVQKVNSGIEGDPFDRDQRIALYARWLFTKAHAEVYFEYGLNDNSYNFRDFAGSPDHGRSYIFGFSKLVPLISRKDEFIQVNAEITQLSQSVDRMVRPAGSFYQHYGIRQGYTNYGQVLGAGTGSGGNLQSVEVSWIKGLKKLGIAFERYEHSADFYEESIGDLNGNSRRWVDFALAAQGEWSYKNLLFSAKLQGIKSLNYQWRMKDYIEDQYYIPHNDVFNVHAELGAAFRF